MDEAEAIRAELAGAVDHNFLRFMAPAFLHPNSKKQRSRSSSVETTLADDAVAKRIERLSVEMFENVGEAIRGEFTPAILEYQLLAKMNKVASDNYQNMADFAQGVAVFVESLKAKHTELLPRSSASTRWSPRSRRWRPSCSRSTPSPRALSPGGTGSLPLPEDTGEGARRPAPT